MLVHEKIRLARLAKGWTQEDVANRMEMSINGYGDIERGSCDIKLSKLEKLAELFEMTLSELIGLNEKSFFYQTGTQNSITQNYCAIGTICSPEFLQLKAELEKQQLINEERSREIALLRDMIELMRANNCY